MPPEDQDDSRRADEEGGENSLAHLKRFKGMYDNSPYRHNIVDMRGKQKAKRRGEEKLQAKIDKVHATLAAMNGIDEEYVARRSRRRFCTKRLTMLKRARLGSASARGGCGED